MPHFSKENFSNVALVKHFEAVAKKYGATTSQTTLAWYLVKHPDMIPIPGNKTVFRLEGMQAVQGLPLMKVT